MTEIEKAAPGPLPPPPRAARPGPRRSVAEKYPPLLHGQLNYETHTEPPLSPKHHEESKIAIAATQKKPRHEPFEAPPPPPPPVAAPPEESKDPHPLPPQAGGNKALAREMQATRAELLRAESVQASLRLK